MTELERVEPSDHEEIVRHAITPAIVLRSDDGREFVVREWHPHVVNGDEMIKIDMTVMVRSERKQEILKDMFDRERDEQSIAKELEDLKAKYEFQLKRLDRVKDLAERIGEMADVRGKKR